MEYGFYPDGLEDLSSFRKDTPITVIGVITYSLWLKSKIGQHIDAY